MISNADGKRALLRRLPLCDVGIKDIRVLEDGVKGIFVVDQERANDQCVI